MGTTAVLVVLKQMESSKDNKYAKNPADSNVLDELRSILSDLGEDQNSDDTITKIDAFLGKRFNVVSLTQSFSHSAMVNDNRTMVFVSSAFTQLIEYVNRVEPLSPTMGNLIDGLLENIGSFNKCLSSQRPGLVAPMLRLMIATISFHNSEKLDKFLETFDLSLKVLPKLAIPTKAELLEPERCRTEASMRYYFILWWITLCKLAPPLSRRDILTANGRIMSNIFKYIANYDSLKLQEAVLDFLDESILMEPTYKKMTKCKIIGDWVISKLADLYSVSSLTDHLQPLLLKMCTDPVNGLVFNADKFWFADDSSSYSTGATVSIGEKTFSVYNKLIYTLLIRLSPCTDTLQCDLVVRILENIPELVPIYGYYTFFTNGAHDPKLTSFYMGQSYLILRSVRLPVPKQFQESLKVRCNTMGAKTDEDSDLPISNILEAVCPGQVTKSALIKGLESKCSLIVHITTVLMIAVFQKYQRMDEVLSYDNNNRYSVVSRQLIDVIQSDKFPPISLISGKINELLDSGSKNRMLLLNYLKVAEYYREIFGEIPNIHPGQFNVGQFDTNFKEIDLAILGSYLKLSADSTEQSSWWRPEKGAKHTIFTSLLCLPYRLAARNNSGTISDEEIVSVLSPLVDKTLIFTDFRSKGETALVSQLFALLISLRKSFKLIDESQIDQVCGIIDQAIFRCVKSPYKYIDQAAAFSRHLSPLYVAIVEQSKFVKDQTSVSAWLKLLTKYLAISGEPLEAMGSCIKGFWEDKIDVSFDLNAYDGDADDVEHALSDFETIVDTPLSDLEQRLKRFIPTSDSQAISLLIKCKILIHSNQSLHAVKNVISLLLTKVGNYLLEMYGQSTKTSPLFSLKYWKPLIVNDFQDTEEKRLFATSLVNEIFRMLCHGNYNSPGLDYGQLIFELLSKVSSKLDLDVTPVVNSLVWVLNNQQVKQLLTSTCLPLDALLAEASTRKISLTCDEYLDVLSKNQTSSLVNLANFVAVNDLFITKLLKIRPIPSAVIKQVLRRHPEFVKQVAEFSSDHLKMLIADALDFLQFLSTQDEKLGDVLRPMFVDSVEKVISTKKGIDVKLNIYLDVISKKADAQDLAKLVQQLLDIPEFYNEANLVFSKEFVHTLVSCSKKLPEQTLQFWISREVLYATKMFSELEGDTLPGQFTDFLVSLEHLLPLLPVPKLVSSKLLNSQLEVVLSSKWVADSQVLKYVLTTLIAGGDKVVEASRLVQVFVNCEHIALKHTPTTKLELETRFYSALVLYHLISFNAKQVSTAEIEVALMKFHLGSNFPDDYILRAALTIIESHLESSWASYVVDWEFEEDEDVDGSITGDDFKLVKSSPSSNFDLRVTVRKTMISNTINKFSDSFAGELKTDGDLESWAKFFDHYTVSIGDRLTKDDFCYDSTFLMLLIINNDELFKIDESIHVSVKPLVESGLLQLIVMNLASADENVRKIARKLVCTIYQELENQIRIAEAKENKDSTEQVPVNFYPYRERTIFKLFLGNLLNTLDKAEADETNEASKRPVVPVVIVFLSYLIPVLTNPGHFMYEKVYRFLLGAPEFRTYEVPLYKPVMCLFTKDTHAAMESDNSEEYYLRLGWFLQTLEKSITSADDVYLLRKGSFIDTLLILAASPFIYTKMHVLIIKVLLKIIQFPVGSDLLIRSSGFLAFVEQHAGELRSAVKQSTEHQNLKAVSNYLLLDYQRMAVEAAISAGCNGASKRAYEWTRGDLDRSVKRVFS